MLPAASVSGIYFAAPAGALLRRGPIGRDQVESYAERKGMPVEEVERWLAPEPPLRARPGAAPPPDRCRRGGAPPLPSFGA